jgi:spore coat protein U-like protein
MPLRTLATFCALLLPGPAWAACTVSATTLAFGNYSPRDPGITSTVGSVRLTCTALLQLNVQYTIALSAGGGSYAARRMTSGASTLAYQLYRDSAGTSIWGDGTAGTATVQGVETLVLLSSGRNFPVYGRMPARQNVAPGAYADTVLVTVTY